MRLRTTDDDEIRNRVDDRGVTACDLEGYGLRFMQPPEIMTLRTMYSTFKDESEVPADEMMKLIRAQSLIRGFLQRRAYRAKKLEHEGSSKYFTSEEAKETIGGEF